MVANPLKVLAVVAHPDDIEFQMAGTLLLLKDAGADIHMWNLANGSCGSTIYPREEIIAMRWAEAQAAAHEAGATIHAPLVDDLCIFYTAELVAQVAAIVRTVQPAIVLTHPPQDYMEDHMNTCRLVVAGAFIRGAPNYQSNPPVPAWMGETVVYHAMPVGLTDPLRHRVQPEFYVDIGSTLARKRSMLAKHVSQKAWLDSSQGMDSYLVDMENTSRVVGKMSGRFEYAEGWRRHQHQGFASESADPLQDMLGDRCKVNADYTASLR
jgi:N-acetylglucosamine malate deacetylase 1